MSEISDLQKKEDRKQELRTRDAETQMALGLFVVVISVPVLIGTLWADRMHAAVVNVIAGGVLLSIGVILAVFGMRARSRMAAEQRDK
jgi:hypothetical protein